MTTLSKWGNSQGLRVPKEACELLGLALGARARVTVNEPLCQVTFTFEQPTPPRRRLRKTSIEELFDGYESGYVPPADWPLVGDEVSWGESVGQEVW